MGKMKTLEEGKKGGGVDDGLHQVAYSSFTVSFLFFVFFFKILTTRYVQWDGFVNNKKKKVCVCGGSGSDGDSGKCKVEGITV